MNLANTILRQCIQPHWFIITITLSFLSTNVLSDVPSIISTVAGGGDSETGYGGDGGVATDAALNNPHGIAINNNNLYIADEKNHRIRKVDLTTGIISTIAGNGSTGYSGDGSAATSATLNYPIDVAIDSVGNLYIADNNNNCIRKVNAATNIIDTFAGNCSNAGYNGDGRIATTATLSNPTGIALDSSDNLYIAEYGNSIIRRVDKNTGTISTVAGDRSYGYSGDGAAAINAQLSAPIDVALDHNDNIYIAEIGNNIIRRVDKNTGNISTVAGNGSRGYGGDNGIATNAVIVHIPTACGKAGRQSPVRAAVITRAR